jgi:CxxC motif-containing protein
MSEPKVERYVCIGCPIGCPLQLVHEGNEIKEVEGYECNRGAKYAKQEFVDPRRAFATTVPISGALYARLPVKLTAPIPKDRIWDAVAAIKQVGATAPVRRGDVIVRDVAGVAGVDVVASRTMEKVAG